MYLNNIIMFCEWEFYNFNFLKNTTNNSVFINIMLHPSISYVIKYICLKIYTDAESVQK